MTTFKSIVIAAVVALIISVGAIFLLARPSTSGQSLGAGGDVETNIPTFVNGLGIGNNETLIYKAPVIGPAQNQASWYNNLGRAVVVEYSEIYFAGTASSSLRASMGTTSAATISNNFAAPFASSVDNALVATGTVNLVINSDFSSSGNGKGSMVVLPGQYFYWFFRQDDGRACTGSVCEAATSTNRGFTNAYAMFSGHYRQ